MDLGDSVKVIERDLDFVESGANLSRAFDFYNDGDLVGCITLYENERSDNKISEFKVLIDDEENCGKGIGFEAYKKLGNFLSNEGKTFISYPVSNPQYFSNKVRGLWVKLCKNGLARFDDSLGRYIFINREN